MERKWIRQNGSQEVILFFNGWGMDEHAFSHLGGTQDLLMFYDYRNISGTEVSLPDTYESVYVIAWSMGVWVASELLSAWKLPVKAAIAINGTERPVDERYGITPKVYLMTEKGMTESGREKFFGKMVLDTVERKRFMEQQPQRPLADQIAELKAIRIQSAGTVSEIKWDKAYVSQEDKIFPVVNQENWWNNRTKIIYLHGGHYPFYQWETWDSIMKV